MKDSELEGKYIHGMDSRILFYYKGYEIPDFQLKIDGLSDRRISLLKSKLAKTTLSDFKQSERQLKERGWEILPRSIYENTKEFTLVNSEKEEIIVSSNEFYGWFDKAGSIIESEYLKHPVTLQYHRNRHIENILS